MADNPLPVRQLWHLLESLHALLYYAPEAFEEAAELGYATDTRWPSYFAWRPAPLGPVGPEVVTSAFYSFSPSTVAEYVPAAWSVASPEQVLEARLRAVDRAFRALPDASASDPAVAEAAGLARRAAEAACTAGRPLAAANAALPWPEEPHLQLWHAATVLREHRGDGHISALMTAGLDPCEALVSFAAVGAAPVEVFASRGWTEKEWAAAQDRLITRGWVDARGQATPRGREGRAEVERITDELATGPWQALGAEGAERLAQLTFPLTMAVVQTGLLPQQSTLGIGGSQ